MKVMNFDGEVFFYRNCGDFDFFYIGIDIFFIYDFVGNKLLLKFMMIFLNMNEKLIYLYYRFFYYFIVIYWGNKGEGGGDVLVDIEKNVFFYFCFVNDFYGNFFILVLGYSFYCGYFIQSLELGQLIEKIEKQIVFGKCFGQDEQKFKELVVILIENDNNVLFIGKVKK